MHRFRPRQLPSSGALAGLRPPRNSGSDSLKPRGRKLVLRDWDHLPGGSDRAGAATSVLA